MCVCDVSGGDVGADGDGVDRGAGAADQPLPGDACPPTPLPHPLLLLQGHAAVSQWAVGWGLWCLVT